MPCPPAILPKQPQRNVSERIVRAANALYDIRWDSQAIRLHRRKVRQWKIRNIAEVVHAPVVHRKGCGEGQVIEVDPEFRVMAPNRPGKIIGELVAPFRALNERIGLMAQIRVPDDIHRWTIARIDLLVEKVGQAPARVLETKLIDFVVADRPGVLKEAGHIAVRLLRGPRIRILSEWLVLPIDLNTRHCARADIRPQRYPIAIAQVVIQTQRIEAGAFENRKVPDVACGRRQSQETCR